MQRVDFAYAIAGVLLTLACGSSRNPITCRERSDCPSGGLCYDGYCFAAEPPVATIGLPGDELVTHRKLVIDGAGSRDPNRGGAVVAFSWSIVRGSGTHCDPVPNEGTGSALETVFMCEGDYEVRLIVKNELGLESAPARQAITVAPSLNAPSIVSKGVDVTVSHRCSGSPPACSLMTPDGADSVRLLVEAEDVESGAALAYEWTVEAPPGIDAGGVVFDPNPRSSTPLVRIQTVGRIAGDWVFTATVTDVDGFVSVAQQNVAVSNSAPTITGAPRLDVHHNCVAEQGKYLATGTFSAQVNDPEGGPVEHEARLVEEKATGCVLAVDRSTLANGALTTEFTIVGWLHQESSFIGHSAGSRLWRAT
jgi:hypothetical protein